MPISRFFSVGFACGGRLRLVRLLAARVQPSFVIRKLERNQPLGGTMDRNTTLTARDCSHVQGDADSERRLWTAVLTLAIEDWRYGNLRKRREAEQFLFKEGNDFNQVCSAAGLEPSHFRARLSKIGRRLETDRPVKHALAA